MTFSTMPPVCVWLWQRGRGLKDINSLRKWTSEQSRKILQLPGLTACNVNAKLIRQYSQQARSASQCPFRTSHRMQIQGNKASLAPLLSIPQHCKIIHSHGFLDFPFVHCCVTKGAAFCSHFLLWHCSLLLLLKILDWTRLWQEQL